MPALPSSLALTNIADGAAVIAADHRTNYAAVQTAVNALIAAESGGTAGQFLTATSSTAVAWAGSYTAYTPTWGGPTPPAIGNGTINGKYLQVGKMVTGQIRIVMGTTSTFGVGAYTFSLPVTSTAVTFLGCGSGYLFDSSADSVWTTAVLQGSTTVVRADITGAAGGYGVGGAGAPFAWAVSDEINLAFTYEAA